MTTPPMLVPGSSTPHTPASRGHHNDVYSFQMLLSTGSVALGYNPGRAMSVQRAGDGGEEREERWKGGKGGDKGQKRGEGRREDRGERRAKGEERGCEKEEGEIVGVREEGCVIHSLQQATEDSKKRFVQIYKK